MDADVIVIGAGIGGLVTAAQLAAGGIDVLVLEKYLIPGGSAGYFDRAVPEGHYRFDVGASMIYGFGTEGTTNLLTRALAAVDERLETIPDPVQISYHLPKGLNLRVHRDYKEFLEELGSHFPDEKVGIRAFYDEAWKVFNCLNAIELKSLEEIRYLTRVFFQNPLACLGLARYLPVNVGSVARKYLKNPDLLKFIDMECYCWSVVPADQTPMINAGMVWADRHYGGINYPQGGVGRIGEALSRGLTKKGGSIRYGARVTKVLIERGRALGVQLATGEVLKAKKVISNATRWDTFGRMIPETDIPPSEIRWRKRYEPSPSFLSVHLGVKREVLAQEANMHHVVLEDWQRLTDEQGTIFVSIPTILDRTIAPADRHIIHTFTPSSMEPWQGLNPVDYAQKKNQDAQRLIERLSNLWPGLAESITFMEIGTPRTHRRFLGRVGGTYGPIPAGIPLGLLGTPFNRTAINGLYCVGDSTFPGQGLNAVAFSGIACAHRVAVDLGITSGIPIRT